MLKVIGSLLALLAALYLIAVNFSAVETRYECTGDLTQSDESFPTTLFLKHQKYRWWVNLWSDSKGSAWIEIPNQTVEYFGNISGDGDILQIADSTGRFKGNFSILSNSLGIEVSGIGIFSGGCTRVGQ